MKIKMELMSDAVFGNGESIPGGEDISIQCDKQGFPYYKGSTFKGIFREELERYLQWTMEDENQRRQKVDSLLGTRGDSRTENNRKMIFSDFQLSDYVKEKMIEEIGENNPLIITEVLSHIRTFTRLTEDGMTEDGSLRSCRCVNKKLVFYSEVFCDDEDIPLVTEVLQMIKWVGSMRNRGFGKVRIQVENV